MTGSMVFQEERCVMCGELVPEGRQVCGSCEERVMGGAQATEGFVDGKTSESADNAPGAPDGVRKKGRVLLLASVASMIDQFNRSNIDILLGFGYEVDVACNFIRESTCSEEKIASLKAELAEKKIRCIQIDFTRDVANLVQEAIAYRQVKRLCTKNRYTFIHCQSPIGGVIGRIVAKQTGTRVIYMAHGFHFYDGAPLKNWILYYSIEKLLSRWTDLLITINQEDYSRAKRSFHAKRTVYVPGVGIDIEKFSNGKVDSAEKRREFGIGSESVMLLSVGELSERKNHRVVIEALAELKDSQIHYFIAGKGELKAELEGLADRLGLGSHVHLLGYRSDISELCHAADLFVFPSRQEGCPVALMEAIACRTPVICSRIRGNTDLIKDEERLFDGESIDDVKRCLRRFSIRRSGEDGVEMDRSVESNLENLRRFELKKVEAEMKDFYRG